MNFMIESQRVKSYTLGDSKCHLAVDDLNLKCSMFEKILAVGVLKSRWMSPSKIRFIACLAHSQKFSFQKIHRLYLHVYIRIWSFINAIKTLKTEKHANDNEFLLENRNSISFIDVGDDFKMLVTESLNLCWCLYYLFVPLQRSLLSIVR